LFCSAARLLAVRVVEAQYHEPRVHVVSDVLSRLGHGVNATEVADIPKVGAKPPVELGHNLVWITFQLLRPIFGELGDRGLRRVPVPNTVEVEVGRGTSEAPKCITEHRR